MTMDIVQDVLEAGELAKLAFYNDIVVGGVCCRVDSSAVGKKVSFRKIVKLKFELTPTLTLNCIQIFSRLVILASSDLNLSPNCALNGGL